MAKMSKVKGSVFERLIAKQIISAVQRPLADGSFTFDRSDCYRTPLSGGHEFAGESDLVISPRLRKLFPFCVECKHRKNFRLEHVFDMGADWKSYHQQVLAASAREGNCRVPLVVIRGNGGRIFAAAPRRQLTQWDAGLSEDGFLMDYVYEGISWRLVAFDHLLDQLRYRADGYTAVLTA